MEKILLVAIVGMAAQLVDGSLGMAYGVTSTTLLLTVGVGAAAASAAVHVAEIGTSLVSGGAHWRFGNVDWTLVRRLALPGGLGAFLGATVLSSLDTEVAEPYVAGILLALGLYLLIRFSRNVRQLKANATVPHAGFVSPLGLVAGFVDSTGGGGWGPISTPALLATRRVAPHKVIGSVSLSEFIVAISASIGFLIGIGSESIPWEYVGALLAGGLVAAPVAAYLVRHIPLQVLGAGVGGMIILTNTRTLLGSFEVTGTWTWLAYGTVAVAWLAAISIAARHVKAERREARRVRAEESLVGAGRLSHPRPGQSS
jgi:uncharacterized membrane protein YfcA